MSTEFHDQGDLRVAKVADLGPFGNNAYVIIDTAFGESLIVDAPAGSTEVLQAAKGTRVLGILLTHTHQDHWAELHLVKDATDASVSCHPAERNLPADRFERALGDGDEIAVGQFRVRAIYTPGHTPGSTCFLAGGILLSGDTLFPGGPGHTRTPQDLQQTIASITERLFVLPEETLVLPGHGADTTIGEAKREYEEFASRPHAPDLCGDVLWASS